MPILTSLRLPIAIAGAILASVISPVLLGEGTQQEEALARGKEITFDRVKGNCLACHVIDDGELPGNMAPPLVAMQARFPDKAVLRAQIWDATVRNPESVMPPYGRHRILTEDEIDLVVDYLYSL